MKLTLKRLYYYSQNEHYKNLFISGFIFCLFLVLQPVAQTGTIPFTEMTPDAQHNLWKINDHTQLYVGASFYYMDPNDSIIVWCDTSESDKMGDLFFMVPGFSDSSLFLFSNREQGTRINISELLGYSIPIRTEVFFMYTFDSAQTKRFTGQNRPGVDPENNYPGADFVADDYCVSYDYGYRWAVAGRICDDSGNPNDTLIFGFEDDRFFIPGLEPNEFGADGDFNDVIFRVQGLRLNVELIPDSISLIVSENQIAAGDTVLCTAGIFADSSGIQKRVPNFDTLIHWELINAGVNRDTLIEATDADSIARFIGKTSHDSCIIRAWFEDPLTNEVFSAQRTVSVIAGPPASLSLELSADTSSSMNSAFPAGRMQIVSNQVSRPVYALLRDRFGNFASFSQQTTWDTLTISGQPGMISGIATVTNGDTGIGEGVVSKAGGSGNIVVTACDNSTGSSLCDSVIVNIVGTNYDSVRIVIITDEGDFVRIPSLTVSTDQCTTLYAQGHRTDNNTWERIDVQWKYTFPWNDSILAEQSEFCPDDTGNGSVAIQQNAYVRSSIPLTVIPGAPHHMILYGDDSPLPDDSTATAGQPFECSARLFDKNNVWLSHIRYLTETTPLQWQIIEDTPPATADDSTGAFTRQQYYSATYLPEKAHRTVTLKAIWGEFTDTCLLRILPGEPYQLVIESSGDWRQSPNNPAPIDTIEISDRITSNTVYAMVRDSLGNFVDTLRSGTWGCIDTLVSVSAASVEGVGTLVKNISVKEGITHIHVVSESGTLTDSAWVRLLPYHFIDLRIVNSGNEDVTKLSCTTNDDTTIIMQGLRSDTALWRNVDGNWTASMSLQLTPEPPTSEAIYDFSPVKAADGWIAAVLPSDSLTDTLTVSFTRGKPLRVTVELLTPSGQRIAGDTLEAMVTIYSRHGPVEGTWCFSDDSSSGPVYYIDSLGNGERSFDPEVIIGNKSAPVVTPEHPGDGSTQCFHEGTDTVKLLLYYVPDDRDSLHRIRFLAGDLTAATDPFRLLPGALASVTITHNKPRNGSDTLYLQAPEETALLTAIGRDRFENSLGEIRSHWRRDGSLPLPPVVGAASRVLYTTRGVDEYLRGTVYAQAEDDSTLMGSLPVSILRPAATAVSALTFDEDGNGLLDRIDITFSLSVILRDPSQAASNLEITANDNILTVEQVTEGDDSTIIRCFLEETVTTDPQTGWTPTISFSNDSLPLLGAVDSFSIAATDGAGPVIWTVTKVLSDADRRSSDRVIVVFSEDITNRNRQQIPTSTRPSALFHVWERSGSRYTEVSIINGIRGITGTPSGDTLIFTMKNGRDLTNKYYFTIKTINDTIEHAPIIDENEGNIPPLNNHHVRVAVIGSPTSNLKIAPNPMKPTSRREAPGVFRLRHNPAARDWVYEDGGGTVIHFKIAMPEDAKLKISGKMTIMDFVGNRVTSSPESYWAIGNVFSNDPNKRVYMNEVQKDIVPSTWEADGTVYNFDVYWNGYTDQGIPAAPGIYRAALVLLIQTSEGKEVRRYSDLIGIGR